MSLPSLSPSAFLLMWQTLSSALTNSILSALRTFPCNFLLSLFPPSSVRWNLWSSMLATNYSHFGEILRDNVTYPSFLESVLLIWWRARHSQIFKFHQVISMCKMKNHWLKCHLFRGAFSDSPVRIPDCFWFKYLLHIIWLYLTFTSPARL